MYGKICLLGLKSAGRKEGQGKGRSTTHGVAEGPTVTNIEALIYWHLRWKVRGLAMGRTLPAVEPAILGRNRLIKYYGSTAPAVPLASTL